MENEELGAQTISDRDGYDTRQWISSIGAYPSVYSEAHQG
jgi:hypothetical protein